MFRPGVLARAGLLACCLAANAPGAIAQLPDLINNGITQRVEDSVAGQVAKKVEDSVQQSVQQSVQGAVDTAVDNSVSRAVNNAVEGAVEPVVGQLDGVVGGVVDNLTGQLPTLSPAPREVAVENNWRAIDHEWIALLAPEQLPALNTANIRILSRTRLAASGLVLVRVVVSDQDNSPGRAQQILRSLGATAADRNHVYSAQDRPSPDEPAPLPAPGPKPASAKSQVRIGLIDTALNRKHPSLKNASIVQKDFVDGKEARPTAHGTGIASLLVGREKGHEGLLPRGRLIAASVFYQGEKGSTGATTSSLVASLDWMAAQNVGVVNMSLAGPPNDVLGAIIARLSAQGMLVVAAVGNDGPASRPLYPAAFEPVVAVTAVDRKNQIYRWANQGPQVDIAAWGVGSVVARDKGGYAEESGTSFAAPIVAAAIAQRLAEGAKTTSAALKSLIASAEDLGAAGRDNVYGYGLIKPAAASR